MLGLRENRVRNPVSVHRACAVIFNADFHGNEKSDEEILFHIFGLFCFEMIFFFFFFFIIEYRELKPELFRKNTKTEIDIFQIFIDPV